MFASFYVGIRIHEGNLSMLLNDIEKIIMNRKERWRGRRNCMSVDENMIDSGDMMGHEREAGMFYM